MYAAVIVNLGSAGAAVAVINLATSLECEFSRFAVLYHHGDKEALRRYKDAYDWVLTRKLPSKYVKEKYTFERLQQFGMDKRVSWISYGMALSFATGVVFAFVSFVYWVALTQGVDYLLPFCKRSGSPRRPARSSGMKPANGTLTCWSQKHEIFRRKWVLKMVSMLGMSPCLSFLSHQNEDKPVVEVATHYDAIDAKCARFARSKLAKYPSCRL